MTKKELRHWIDFGNNEIKEYLSFVSILEQELAKR